MSVVLDANVVAALVIPLPYSDQAQRWMNHWQRDGVALVAPVLLQYELVTVLRKAIVEGIMTSLEAVEALDALLAVGVEIVAPTRVLHERALYWSDQLGQRLAYDAQYVALAEHLRGELWTADRRLANGARQAGAAWVRWIGEDVESRLQQP